MLMSINQIAFMDDRARANVGTSRQWEVLYSVGQFKFWSMFPKFKKRMIVMHGIMKYNDGNAAPKNRAPFVIQR